MAEITLGDLLAWEPNLRLVGGPGRAGGWSGANGATAEPGTTDRELTWVVAARARAPMLPTLRGGELVVLSRRVLIEGGVALAPLLRELVGHGVAAAVLDADAVPPGLLAVGPPLPVLAPPIGPIPTELEGDLNRLLTERRGELYRAGTELGRVLAGLTAAGAGLEQVLNVASETLGIPVLVVDARGSVLAASDGQTYRPATNGATDGAFTEGRVAVRLIDGETLWLGPVAAGQHALARLVGERVAGAAEAALAHAVRTRPRGPARASALAALLVAQPERPAETLAGLTALGLAADGSFRVALGSDRLGETGLARALQPYGQMHQAAPIDGALAALIEVRREPAPPAAISAGGARVRPGGRSSGLSEGDGWLAVSAPVAGAAGLPEATRQARYVAALLAAELVPGPCVHFDAVVDLGAYRLLFGQWGNPDLAAFAAGGLGELPGRDRRGALRRTLQVYLETGGSHVEAAARLAIHRNTLAYRLKQIAALTGHDPTDASKRLLLHLALLAAALPPAP